MFSAVSEVQYSHPHTSGLPSSQVKTLHRRMHPESSSFLVTTTDDATYVLKGLSAISGPALVKEVVGSELGSQLQLPMASWRVLARSRQILDAHAHLFESVTKRENDMAQVMPQPYFGSCVPVGTGRFFEYLPSSRLDADPQARAALGLIQIFDLWVGQSEPRQYLVRPGADETVSLKFIRNSAILGDPLLYMLREKNALPVYLRACLLAGSRPRVQALIEKILQWSSASLAETLASLPIAWTAKFEGRQAIDHLIRRQKLLGNLWTGWQTWTPEKTYESTPVLWDTSARKDS